MADQQPSEQLEELQSELADLEQQVSALEAKQRILTRDCKALEARKRFISDAVAKLGAELTAGKTESQSVIDDLATQISTLKDDQVVLGKEIGSLRLKKSALESDLKTMQKATDNEVAKLNGILKAKKQEITDAVSELKIQHDELLVVKDDIISARKGLAEVDNELDIAENARDKKLSEINKEIDESRKELKEVQLGIQKARIGLTEAQKQLEQAKSELATTRKAAKEFGDKKKRVIAALTAREQAIDLKEQDLEARIITSRRRHGVAVEELQ